MTEKQAFWTSLPGILTGVAAIITAITGLYIAIFNFTPKATGDISSEAPINQPLESNKPNNDPPLTPSLNSQTGSMKPAVVKVKRELNEQDFISFPKIGPLLVCENFATVNTHSSLMSWSNYYHKQILDGNDSKPDYACNKTIGYRGMAHCREPDNQQTRQALLETLALCRKLGFESHQVTLD